MSEDDLVLETMTADTFTPHVGQELTLRLAPDHGITVRLSEVQRKGGGWRQAGEAEAPVRGQFSLFFVGPREPRLPQRIYTLEHPALGSLDLFLVPVAESEAGRTYEAAFT